MAALPLEQRIERLPNWAQAYIGRLTRQILKLTDRANAVTVDPTPVFSIDEVDGEVVQNFLAMPSNNFCVEVSGIRFHLTIQENTSSPQLNVRCDKPFAMFPMATNQVDFVAVKKG